MDEESRRQLLEEIENLKSKNEEMKQKVHAAKNAKTIEDLCVAELNEEIEHLRQMILEQSQNCNKTKTFKTEQVKSLKQEAIQLQEKLAQQQEIKEQLTEVICRKSANQKNTCQQDDLSIEDALKNLTQAKIKNEKLKVDIEKHKLINEQQEETEKEINGFNTQIKSLSIDTEHLESKYDGLRGEFLNTRENYQRIRQNNRKLSSEIALLKEGPVETKRGNCLFAEIEDKSSTSLYKINLLKKKYDMKKPLLAKNKLEIERLKAENAHLLRSQVGLNPALEIKDDGKMGKLVQRIYELEESVSDNDKRPRVPSLILENDNLQWIQAFIDKESQKAKLSDDKFRNASKELYDTAFELYNQSIEYEKVCQENHMHEQRVEELMLKLCEKEKMEENTKIVKENNQEKQKKTVRFENDDA